MNESPNNAASSVLSRATAALHEQEQRTRDVYLRGVARLADGRDMSDAETDEFVAAMKEVVLNVYEPHKRSVTRDELFKHVAGLKELRRRERALAELKASANLPPAGELRRRLDEIDAEIAPQIARLLQPKRELERQIEQRKSLDEQILSAERLAGDARKDFPFAVPE